MPRLRKFISRAMPPFAGRPLVRLINKLFPPAFDDVVLQTYEMVPDADTGLRMSLVLPSIDPAWAFGGVTTGIDIFLELCRRTGAEPRFITEGQADRALVERRPSSRGLKPQYVDNVRQSGDVARISVRATDIFVTYNWWTTLNIRPLLDQQRHHFGGPAKPFIYLIQDYEPSFYGFSSAHMLARLAIGQDRPWWGIFNSSQLYNFFIAQGHTVDRAFVFEPKISEGLRPAFKQGAIAKTKRILVYGRPTIPRNCFPAVQRGLTLWAQQHPQFADWEVVSAGMAHKPIPIAPGRSITSLGKLSLDAYADLLRTTSVGLSLMASPHPSYPPLEMAHFGLLTITNRYPNKDLALVHDNFISIPDIDAATISTALAQACERFEAAPGGGWEGRSHMPAYLDEAPWAFFDAVAVGLREVWSGAAPASRAEAAALAAT